MALIAPPKKVSSFSKYPAHLVQNIFSYLELKDKVRGSSTSKFFYICSLNQAIVDEIANFEESIQFIETCLNSKNTSLKQINVRILASKTNFLFFKLRRREIYEEISEIICGLNDKIFFELLDSCCINRPDDLDLLIAIAYSRQNDQQSRSLLYLVGHLLTCEKFLEAYKLAKEIPLMGIQSIALRAIAFKYLEKGEATQAYDIAKLIDKEETRDDAYSLIALNQEIQKKNLAILIADQIVNPIIRKNTINNLKNLNQNHGVRIVFF